MPFKKTNMIIIILILLLALYLFTVNNQNSDSNKINTNNTPAYNTNNTPAYNTTNEINYISNKKEDTFTSNKNVKVGKGEYTDDSSIVNNKIKIVNRNDSLLQQVIKNDSLTHKNIENDNLLQQGIKNNSLLQQGIREDLEKEVDNVFNRLKQINNDEKNSSGTTINTFGVTQPSMANSLINTDKYKGYNNYESLRKDSYAPVTSIGKQLITPFASFPVAS